VGKNEKNKENPHGNAQINISAVELNPEKLHVISKASNKLPKYVIATVFVEIVWLPLFVCRAG